MAGKMFDGLSGRLSGIFDKLRKRGALTDSDVVEALREVRVALLEADVALPVVKSFIDKVPRHLPRGHPRRVPLLQLRRRHACTALTPCH